MQRQEGSDVKTMKLAQVATEAAKRDLSPLGITLAEAGLAFDDAWRLPHGTSAVRISAFMDLFEPVIGGR